MNLPLYSLISLPLKTFRSSLILQTCTIGMKNSPPDFGTGEVAVKRKSMKEQMLSVPIEDRT